MKIRKVSHDIISKNNRYLTDGTIESAFAKARALFEADCVFSEFGTRRRRSYHTQDIAVQEFVRASKEIPNHKGGLTGTSNVCSSR